jgi:hypothetical protein
MMKKQVQQALLHLSCLVSLSLLVWTQAAQAQTTWTSRTSATDNNWNGITYGNGLFVATAWSGTGDRVMTSPDGITWTSRTSAANNRWIAVTYGNGTFVAVSWSGTSRVMTSPDGITWTSQTSAADNSWFGVTYGNGLFVAIAESGTGNRVMTSPDAVLPVELLSFTGKHTEGGNLLTWTTANEVNNKGFQVERQQATGDSWDILGFKTANSKASTYQFTDDAPFTTSYYRLRQIDNDGTETLSKVISIAAVETRHALSLHPNPVSNTLTIETDLSGNFQILNLLGQQVLTGKTTAQRIDVSALPQGSYVLKVGAEQVKFVKQ